MERERNRRGGGRWDVLKWERTESYGEVRKYECFVNMVEDFIRESERRGWRGRRWREVIQCMKCLNGCFRIREKREQK